MRSTASHSPQTDADPQGPHARVDRFRRVLELVKRLERVLRALEQDRAVARQLHAVSPADEQRDPQLALELTHLLAQRRL
jgi:hypothetical protein